MPSRVLLLTQRWGPEKSKTIENLYYSYPAANINITFFSAIRPRFEGRKVGVRDVSGERPPDDEMWALAPLSSNLTLPARRFLRRGFEPVSWSAGPEELFTAPALEPTLSTVDVLLWSQGVW